jgi:hypothetical protein
MSSSPNLDDFFNTLEYGRHDAHVKAEEEGDDEALTEAEESIFDAEDEEVVGDEAQPCKRPRNEPNVPGDFGYKSRYPLTVSVESVRERKGKPTMAGKMVFAVFMDGFVPPW